MDQTPAQVPTIRILRAGTFRSVEGKPVTFGAAELAAIAAGYDPEGDPAPLVIGHPKMDDPAWGWVGSLEVENGALVARPSTIEASFAERVRRGEYRKVSARLYEPGNPHNPKPGQFYLKHIGFLGAHAPGVKGLGTVQFAEGEPDDLVTIDSKPEISPVTDKVAKKATTTTRTADPANPADPAADQVAAAHEREADLNAREARIARREKDQAEAAAAARHDANVSYAEGLISEAKLAPAGKELLVGVLDQLGELDAEATISFGESETIRPDAALRKLLADASPLVSFAEAAGREKKAGGTGFASFAVPAGYTVDPAQAQLHAEAMRIKAANRQLLWPDCVREAQAALTA